MQELPSGDVSRPDFVVGSTAVRPGRMRHPVFFSAMSAVLITGVFLGFAPTYYLRPPESVPIPRYLHVHGAAMTAWFLLLLLQSLLIATGRRSIHRRTGIAGAVIAVVITLVNPFVVVWGVPKGLALGMPIDLVTFITIADLSAMVVFAVLTGLALAWRRHPEAHSRMLLLASIAMSGPAFGRLSINTTGTLAGLSIQVVLPLLIALHDRIVTKRVHPATTWGSIAVIGSLVSSIAVAGTQMGQSMVRLLER